VSIVKHTTKVFTNATAKVKRRFVHPPFFVFVLPHFLQIQLMGFTSEKKNLQNSSFLARLLVIVTFEGAMMPLLLKSQIARKCTQKKCTLVQLSRLSANISI
jgi:hypothetical protein